MSRWIPSRLTPARLAPVAWTPDPPAVAADPLLSWGTDFRTAPADPAESGWDPYKPLAIARGECDSQGLHIESTSGGGGDYLTADDEDASLWFTNNASYQVRGLAFQKAIGPAAGTSRDWDVRGRLRLRNAAGGTTLTPESSIWEALSIGVHDPDRSSYLRYIHAGPIKEGLVPENGLEIKVNRVNAAGGASVYPVTTHPGGALDYDVRIVRVGQLLTIYYRLVSSGEALESDVGWTLGYVVDWADGESVDDTFPACPQETDAGMPDDVLITIYIYGNRTTPAVSGIVDEIQAKPIAA